MVRRHNKHCDNLEKRVQDNSRIIDTYTNKEYGNVLGEVDVYSKQYINGKYYHVYYEVKCNNKPQGYIKAQKQLIRWSKWYHKQTGETCYGVYWTPQKVILMAKNGRLR